MSGELFTYYADWKIESCSEVIFDCMSGSVPHKHCMDTLYARKPMKSELSEIENESKVIG